jgi:FkbM family methyltransferase
VFVDFGGNRGAFSQAVAGRFGLKPALIVEANPELARKLRENAGWTVENCAVSSRDGFLTFNIAANDEGSSILALPDQSSLGCTAVGAVTVQSRTLESLVAMLPAGPIDLLKMDIEGAEVEVLLTSPDAVLRRFSQITVEFHCDPVFGFGGRAEVERVIARMRSLGFECLWFDFTLRDVLFVNHGQLGLSGLDRLRMRLVPAPPPILSKAWFALPAPVRRTIKSGIARLRGTI